MVLQRWLLVPLCVLGASCASEQRTQPASIRLVQTELRREFNTRYLTVSESPPDTLVVALSGGRLMRGVSGRLSVSEAERATLARRAVQLLAPGASPETAGVKAVVVDVAESRRFGPLVWSGSRSRSVHGVTGLLSPAAEHTSPAKKFVELQTAEADSVR